MHRFQVSVFGSIAIVFAVFGVNQGIFSGQASLDAMAAGWLILAIVNILWVLYFTSEEDSLTLHLFNSMGTGGLTPPRRRRTRTANSVHMAGNGYTNTYASGGAEPYDTKMSGMGSVGPGIRSQNSFAGSLNDGAQNRSAVTGGAGSIHNSPTGGGTGSLGGGDNTGSHSPLMAGVGAGNIGGAPPADIAPPADSYSYKAKALYACQFSHCIQISDQS